MLLFCYINLVKFENFDSPRFLEWLIIWNGGSSGQWIQLWDGVVVALPSAFTVSLSILEHWSKECCVLDPTVCWGWPWLLMKQIVVSWQRSYITLLCPLDVWPFWILIVSPTTRNVVIYDENFMIFSNSVTIAHNPWQFSDFHHEFEGMGPRPKT